LQRQEVVEQEHKVELMRTREVKYQMNYVKKY
jgi:hypothetical protein